MKPMTQVIGLISQAMFKNNNKGPTTLAQAPKPM